MANSNSSYVKKLKDGALNQVVNDLIMAKGLVVMKLKIRVELMAQRSMDQ